MRKLSLIIIAFLVVTPIFEAEARRKIEVARALSDDLNSVLKAANTLHTACVERNEQKIDSALSVAISSIDRAKRKSFLAKQQRPHLMKILEAAREELEASRVHSGTERRKNLKAAFNSLVQVSKVFKLEPYRHFICPADRSVWLQKGWKPKNPINPDRHLNCGKLVR